MAESSTLIFVIIILVFILFIFWCSNRSLSDQNFNLRKENREQGEKLIATEKTLKEKTEASEKYELSYSELESLKKEYSEKLILLEKTKTEQEAEYLSRIDEHDRKYEQKLSALEEAQGDSYALFVARAIHIKKSYENRIRELEENEALNEATFDSRINNIANRYEKLYNENQEKNTIILHDEIKKITAEGEDFKKLLLRQTASKDERLEWYRDILNQLDLQKGNFDSIPHTSDPHPYILNNDFFIDPKMLSLYDISLSNKRVDSAIEENFDFIFDKNQPIPIRDIVFNTFSHGSGRTYTTTLSRCDCKDFDQRKLPCKHMIALAFKLNVYTCIKNNPASFLLNMKKMLNEETELHKKNEKDLTKNIIESKKLRDAQDVMQASLSKLQEERTKFEEERKRFEDKVRFKLDREFKEKQKVIDEKIAIIKEQEQTFPYLAEILSKYRTAKLDIRVKDKVTKKELTQKIRTVEKEKALLENQLAIYEYTFPILEELKTLDVHELEQAIRSADDTGFNYQWLSQEEYATLTSAEKQQKWLERYFHARSRTAWEAGIKYERYIGYLCEKEGYSVNYTGALLKLEDMGRDLIVSKKNTVYIIQCKRFSESKEIHENHVFQLYGSVYHYKAENPTATVFGVFVTTAKLSAIASACAKDLNLTVFENVEFKEYPCIKCNVGSSGEKIYHLPFDQQYDHTHIGKKPGEIYVSTIEEAQTLGFRHAMKHTFIA